MIHSLLVSLPFFVCLFWFILLVIEYPKADAAQQVLTYFILICTILYFSHAVYFYQQIYLYSKIESIYTFCSLAVFPLYYLYILKLTSEKPLTIKSYLVLFPAIIITLASSISYGVMTEATRLRFVESIFFNNNLNYELSFAEVVQTHIIKIAQVVFFVQLLPVLYFGWKRLSRFNNEIINYYTETSNKTLRSIKKLLLLFIFTAFFSALINHLGRFFFIQESWLLVIPSLLFSSLLFMISYLGYKQSFTASDFHKEMEMSKWKETEYEPDATFKALKKRLICLMEEEQLFKQKDLQITDVALETGSNRTYVSKCINKEMGLSFSDYINSYRVKYAQKLMYPPNNLSRSEISELSGFANETSFYRNFKKITGFTPNEWLNEQLKKYEREKITFLI